ncbi:MAG TPA: hypothetical protein VF737_13450, partial [Gemmatimonadaceae bacterium]
MTHSRKLTRSTVALLAAAMLFGARPLAGQRPERPAAPAPAPFDVVEASIADVHAALSDGRITCHALVADYLARIDAYDKNGPAINAIILVNPDALTVADSLDAVAKHGGPLGA